MVLFTLKFNDDDPLFCLSFHPTKPQFVLGFATGRVTGYEYSPSPSDSPDPVEKWTAKRHKGSCRAIGYDQEGDFIVSCGSDGVIKKFSSVTGKISQKTQIKRGATTLCINEQYIMIGDEVGQVHCFQHDLKLHRKYVLPEMDTVTVICPLASVNKHNFAVGADMHVFRIDVRKEEPLSQSDDQEDEVLCGCVASEQRSAWGMSEGVVTVWKNKRLGDQQQRIKLTKEGSVDVLLAAEENDHVIAGTSDGWVAEIDLVAAKVIHKARHSSTNDEEDVGYLDYDFEYRLVTGSTSLLAVWEVDELARVSSELIEKESKRGSKRANDGKSNEKSKKKKTKNSVAPEANAFADLMG